MENMENEITMNEELEVMDEQYEVVTESSEGSNTGATIVKLALVALGAAATAVVIKNRGKIKDWADQRRINKLEKSGRYIVMPRDTEEPKEVDYDPAEDDDLFEEE